MALEIFKNAAEINNDDAMFETLVKLLAEEDIVTIISPTFSTAFFDLKKRMIGIPAWKKMSRALKMVLRFHECSHGLFTHIENFHDFVEGKYPRALAGIINICEDDRVDRLMVKKYPGAKKYYAEGYREIMARFWKDIEVETASFADRLNLDSKAHADFPFTAKNITEAKLHFRFKNTQTPEEVIELAKDIYAYCKEEAKTNQHQQPPSAPNKEQGQQDEEQEKQNEANQNQSGDQEQSEDGEENEQSGGTEGSDEKSEDSAEGGEESEEDNEEGSEGGEVEDGEESNSEADDNNDFEGSDTDSSDGSFTKTQDMFKQAEKDIVEENDESKNKENQQHDYYGRKIDPLSRTIILRANKSNFVGFKEVNKLADNRIEQMRSKKITVWKSP